MQTDYASPDCSLIIPPIPNSAFRFTQYGIVINGKPTFEQWQSAWQWLRQIDRASPWIAGDMLAYGETTYSEFSQELENDEEPERGHYTYGSLRVYKYVSIRWPLLSRLTNIPWSYHQITANLPMAQRIELIQQAMSFKTGRRKWLESQVRQLNNGKEQNPVSNPLDSLYEAEQRAYEAEARAERAEARIAELESNSFELPTGTSAQVDSLRESLAEWLESVGYGWIKVYKNGQMEVGG